MEIVWTELARERGSIEYVGKLGKIKVFNFGYGSLIKGDKPYRLYTSLPGFKHEAMETWRYDTPEEAKERAEVVLLRWLQFTGITSPKST